MTESVQQRTSREIREAMAMEVELSGVDAIAKFKFDDAWKIHEFGAHIDAIPGMTPEYSQTLRGVANLINEPDTETQAFDVSPSFHHTASQERFEAARDASGWDQYLRFSQSQSNSSQVPLVRPSQELGSGQSSFLQPAPNQQANRQQLGVPSSARRKSPRPGVPRMISGYVMEDAGPSKRKADSSHWIPNDKGKTIQMSTSEEEEACRTGKGGLDGEASLDEDEDAMASPQARLKRPRLSDSRISDSEDDRPRGKGKQKAKQSSSSTRSGKKVSHKRPFRPTSDELKELDKASRIPPPEPTRTASTRPAKQAAPKKAAPKKPAPKRSTRAADSMSEDEDEDDDPVGDNSDGDDEDEDEDNRDSNRRPQASQSPRTLQHQVARLKAPNVKTIPGAICEGDIQISGPAKASKLGLPGVLTSGYEGFKYLYSWRSGKYTKEKWKCLGCTNDYTCSRSGHNSNLVTHRALCKGPADVVEGVEVVEGTNQDGQAIIHPPTRAGRSSAVASTAASSTLAASTYRGTSVSGWIGGQQITHPLLTRRLGLIAVINNALPFQHLRSESVVEFVKSIDARATKALKDRRTVRRDLTRFHAALKIDFHQELQQLDTLVSLQHDAWTTKAYQHSFVATIASYVTRDWDYREVLLSFDVIHDKHTGGTFSGHLIRTLHDYDLDDKWYGPVTSDSTGVNHRMLDVLQYQLSRKDMQQRNSIIEADVMDLDSKQKPSPSSFPHASARKKGTWLAEQNKILCFNHHVNIAVRAGFAKFGIKFKAKTKSKVLNLRPAPPIMVTDENGNRVEYEDEDDDDEQDSEEEQEQAGKPGTSGNASDSGDGNGGLDDSDSDPSEDDEGTPAADDLDDGEDEEYSYKTDMEPSPSEIGSEDEGGPAAEPEETEDENDEATDGDPKGKIASSIGKLEAFTVAIHRSPQRRANFRAQMEKEYHRRPKKAQAPFPSKPNGTRWNSHWAMIKRSLRIRDAIDSHCRAFIGSKKEKFGQYLLSDSQWRQLELLKAQARSEAGQSCHNEYGARGGHTVHGVGPPCILAR